jgi:Amidohydrolase
MLFLPRRRLESTFRGHRGRDYERREWAESAPTLLRFSMLAMSARLNLEGASKHENAVWQTETRPAFPRLMDTRTGPPTYADVGKVARAYVRAALERMVWSSDWPNPIEHADAKPNDAILFDLLADWAPDEAIRNRLQVDNPAALYGFD